MMNGMDWGMGWGGMWFGPIFWLLILGLITWAVIWLVNKNRGQGQNYDPSRENALDILKRRYARGEIDREEFAEKRKQLSE